MNIFNPAAFRADFPGLRNRNEVYLDSAATALKPDPVITATTDYYRQQTGNVHRGSYLSAQQLTARYEAARQHVADWIGAGSTESIVWTRGTTESINIVAQCYVRPRLNPGDEILVSEAEHHANLVPWLMVAQQTGARVIKLPVTSQGMPALHLLPSLLNERTRILAITQMSNVTGGMPDLEQAITMAHQVGAKVMVDGAQGIVHSTTNVLSENIDFYAFSGHKLYGPTGIGVLYGKPALLEEMMPWLGGGKMIAHVAFEGFTLQPVPQRFEAGTPNIAGVLGLQTALTWLKQIDMAGAEAWCRALADSAEQALSCHRGFRSFRCQGSGLLSFTVDGVHHQDLAMLLAESGIEVRSGQHCAQPLLTALGVSGTVRASFAPYNNHDDVDKLARAVEHALMILGD